MARLGLIIILGFSLLGCKAKKVPTVVTKNTEEQTVKNKATLKGQLCSDGNNNLVWQQIEKQKCLNWGLKFSDDFIIFQVSNEILSRFFERSARSKETPTLTVPVYLDDKVICASVELAHSGTLPRETEDRMGVYSYKGSGRGVQGARIDYSKKTGMRAYLYVEGETILIEPLLMDQDIYYICFNKKSSRQKKTQFEK